MFSSVSFDFDFAFAFGLGLVCILIWRHNEGVQTFFFERLHAWLVGWLGGNGMEWNGLWKSLYSILYALKRASKRLNVQMPLGLDS